MQDWPSSQEGGLEPFLFEVFATRQNPAESASPRLGLLVPDPADPSGWRWHDAADLGPDITIELPAGTVLRIQTEDESDMARITAQLGAATLVETRMDDEEYPFLMHLDVPVPAGTTTLDVRAEGIVAESGTVPCHLEILGEFGILAPDGFSPGYNDGNFYVELRAAVLPAGVSIVEPQLLIERTSYDTGLGLLPLGAAEQHWSSRWDGGTPPSLIQAVSPSFELPLGADIVLYSKLDQVGVVGNVSDSLDVGLRLVADDPAVSLIYRK
ncbi:MAG: hypothetical protein AB1640_08070 [bacterium]